MPPRFTFYRFEFAENPIENYSTADVFDLKITRSGLFHHVDSKISSKPSCPHLCDNMERNPHKRDFLFSGLFQVYGSPKSGLWLGTAAVKRSGKKKKLKRRSPRFLKLMTAFENGIGLQGSSAHAKSRKPKYSGPYRPFQGLEAPQAL